MENSLKDAIILNKSFVHIEKNSNNKEENELFKKGNATCKNLYSNFSPNKEKRKAGVSSDNLVNIKTKNKLDLITKNMERDRQNLNNPNAFYADLFNNFKRKIKKKESMPKIKVKLDVKGKGNSEKSEEKVKK